MNVRKEEEEHSAEDKLKSQKEIYDGYVMQIANMVVYTLCTVSIHKHKSDDLIELNYRTQV